MTVILTALMAIAGELPPPPSTIAAAAGDCDRVETLRPGPVTRACNSQSVPPADLAHLLAVETWGHEVYDLARIDAAAHADALDAARAREDYWRGLAEQPPRRLSPAAWVGIGAGAGVLAVLGGALAVRAVAEAPLYAE